MSNAKYYLVFVGCLSFFACKTIKKNTETATTKTDPQEAVDTTMALAKPPVYIEGGMIENHLYSNIPNTIRIFTEDGNTSHLEVMTTYGKIQVADAKRGLYDYFSKGKGIVVEIVAIDTINNTFVAKNFELVDMPAPTAILWSYRTRLPQNKVLSFTADEIKRHNAIVLYHNQPIPVRCNARSYQVTRVDKDGKRFVSINESETGQFTEESMSLIQAAQSGDIYIIQDIKTLCSSFPINNIVYVIQ